MAKALPGNVLVWDPFVRVFHWALAAGFFIAYLLEEPVFLHAWVGYAVGALIAARIVWGVVGPKHARFTDFVYRPSAALAYFKDLLGARAKRYLGHSPAGGAMVLALLVMIALTVVTGHLAYEGGGESASAAQTQVVTAAQPQVVAAAQAAEHEEGDGGEGRGGVWGGLHEAFATLTMILVFLHILGVIWASVVHRENLARAMVTGWKRG